MFAAREGSTVTIARDLPEALCGVRAGYGVRLHALPALTFRIAESVAGSIDAAQSQAVAAVRRERTLSTDAATVWRL